MGTITIVGLGPGHADMLTMAAGEALLAAPTVHLRTRRHPTVGWLVERGKALPSFDDRYDAAEDFDALYREIVAELVEAGKHGDVCYAVPGHPLVGESTVQGLLAQTEVPVTVIPGLSGIEATYTLLGIDPVSGLQILDALQLDGLRPNPEMGALVLQVYNRRIAGQVKLALMRFWPDDHPVTLVRAASVPGLEHVETLPLFEIDRRPDVDHLTSLYVPPAAAHGVERLRQIVDRLRSPGGCPWDIEQTHESLCKFVLEEAYETVHAIEGGEDDEISEELGDLLLQIVLHARIAAEREAFDLDEIAEGISDKLVFRHPHVFGDVSVADATEVLVNWEVLKKQEKAAAGIEHASRLGDIPPMAALMHAEKVIGRAVKSGFAWPGVQEAMAKVDEEWAELREAVASGNKPDIEAELGDFLFAFVGVARLLKAPPEDALRLASRRFMDRFEGMERLADERGLDWDAQTLEQRLALWAEAKAELG